MGDADDGVALFEGLEGDDTADVVGLDGGYG